MASFRVTIRTGASKGDSYTCEADSHEGAARSVARKVCRLAGRCGVSRLTGSPKMGGVFGIYTTTNPQSHTGLEVHVTGIRAHSPL